MIRILPRRRNGFSFVLATITVEGRLHLEAEHCDMAGARSWIMATLNRLQAESRRAAA